MASEAADNFPTSRAWWRAARLRHLHAVLQAGRRRGAEEAAGHLVFALHAREGLRDL